MSDNPTAVDDGLTADERHFLATGEASDALLAQNQGLGQPTEPGAPQVPAAEGGGNQPPGAQTQTQDDDGEETAEPGKPPRRVKYATYEAELQAREAAQRELNDFKVRSARVEERLALLQQALQEPAQPQQQQQRPDPQQDIFAHAAYLEQQLAELSGKLNGYEEQITTGQAEMDAQMRYIDSLNRYAGQEPNFTQAYNYLIRSRAAELMAPRYPQATREQLMGAQIPEDVAQILQEEERNLYRGAFEANQNPAETIFFTARARGFNPATSQSPPANNAGNGAAQPQRPGAARPNGNSATAPQANGTQQPTAADLVESIRRGQPAAQSLSTVSGNTGIQLTPETLANMSDAEFAVLFNELQESGNKQRLMELMGS